MGKLTNKIANTLEAIAKDQGQIKLDIDIVSGSMTINGIEFSKNDQVALINERASDPNFSKFLEQIVKKNQMETNEKMVEFNGDDFQINLEKFTSQVDDRDNVIAKLQAENNRLKQQLADQNKVNEQHLQFPEDFYNVWEDEKADVIKELDLDITQKIVDNLKTIEVPYGSFVTYQTGDIIVIKINDHKGVSYIVSNNYHIANVK
ncbi:hypothetical protein [Metabacillus fastidiosus]|uniref:hypothetical protein n=1 Tax=Metabacillus fastidiosus TaxID=1458 RepID=UPI003D2C5A39